jgi:hypothetical protein
VKVDAAQREDLARRGRVRALDAREIEEHAGVSLMLSDEADARVASETVELIQATLAPIFLVSGAAIFLNFTQARLFRVIDRLRSVTKELSKETDARERDNLAWQRTRQLRRAVILRNAILFGVLVIASTVITTLLILLPAEIGGSDAGRWPIYTFTAALLSFAVALTLVVVDAFLSVAAARHVAREFPG